MIIDKDLKEYFEKDFSDFKSTAKECSKDDKGNYLVKSGFEVFNFDKIIHSLSDKTLKSCDAIIFKDNKIIFVEFKQISKSLYLKEKTCPQRKNCFDKSNDDCKKCLKAFENYNKKKLENFKYSIANKIVQSLYVLNKLLLPKCEEKTEKMSLEYILVVDLSNVSNEYTENVLNSLAKKDTDIFDSLKSSICRFQSEYLGKKVFFERTKIMNSETFDKEF